MAALAVFGAVALLAACGDEAEPVATGGELIRLDTVTTAPATTEPAATEAPAPAPSTSAPEAPVDPVDGCLNWYRFKIEAEDDAVLELWEDELDEDLVQLVAECQRLAAEEPDRVQDMIAESKAIDEFLRQAANQASTTTTAG